MRKQDGGSDICSMISHFYSENIEWSEFLIKPLSYLCHPDSPIFCLPNDYQFLIPPLKIMLFLKTIRPELMRYCMENYIHLLANAESDKETKVNKLFGIF